MEDEEFAEVDVLLCLLVGQIARHQQQGESGDTDWVSMGAVQALSQRLGHLGAAAIERGWHTSAFERGLLDVRQGARGPQVRLKPAVAASVGIDLERRTTGPISSIRRLLSRLFGSN